MRMEIDSAILLSAGRGEANTTAEGTASKNLNTNLIVRVLTISLFALAWFANSAAHAIVTACGGVYPNDNEGVMQAQADAAAYGTATCSGTYLLDPDKCGVNQENVVTTAVDQNVDPTTCFAFVVDTTPLPTINACGGIYGTAQQAIDSRNTRNPAPTCSATYINDPDQCSSSESVITTAWEQTPSANYCYAFVTLPTPEMNSDASLGKGDCPSEPASPAPIFFGSGNKYLEATDYSGVGILPLVVRRYYNSLDGVWRFHYQQKLVFDSPLQTTLIRADGRHLDFYLIESGPWAAYSDQSATLSYDSGQDEWIVSYADDMTNTFDGSGRLVEIRNRAGQTVTLSYSGFEIDNVSHFSGRELVMSYDASGNIASVVDPAGNVFSYAYNANDMLVAVSYPDATPLDSNDNPVKTYHYEINDSLVTGITDELGVRYSTYDYDTQGRAITSKLSGDVEQTDVTYNSDGTVSVLNELSKQANYTFVVSQGVRRVTGIDGQPTTLCPAASTSTAYNAFGYATTQTDANGVNTNYVRNSRGLIETKVEAAGTPAERTTTTTWHTDFRVPIQKVLPGRTIDMSYDSSGRILSQTITDTLTLPYPTSTNTRTISYTYNTLGLIDTIDGPRTDLVDVTTYTYDAAGDLLTVQNALGHTTEILQRDARGLPLQIRDPNNIVTQLTYDARGNLTSSSVLHASGNATNTFVYDLASQLIQTIDPEGAYLSYEYDDAHRLVAIENNLGERIEYVLDAAGNRTSSTTRDGASNITRTGTAVFDELSRLRNALGANNQDTSFSYDLKNNVTGIEDGLAFTTTQAYDALDRLIKVTDAHTNDTDQTYDDRDNLTDLSDPRGVLTQYVYDGLNNLIQEISADAGTSVHVYDEAGNRIQTTDPRGIVTQFTYDALNRVTTATYPDSSENITYIYDTGTNGLGRLASVTDEAGSTSFTYDHRGNVLSETKVIGTASYPITYTYDLADRRLSLAYHYPRIIRYSRDSIGRVVSMSLEDSPGVNVQTIANSFAYLPFGIASGWDQANGSVVARTFDLDYRLTEAKMTSSASAAIYSRLYAYDLRNDIISITNVIDSTRNQSFTYDALQRLTQGVGVYGSRDYAYDEVGNRVEKTTDSTIVETLSYSGNNNRLQTASEGSTTRTMQYDLAGNLTFDDRGLDPDLTFTYNNRNRLAAASSTAMSATYKYNAFGQRVSKTVDGQTRHFLYDLSGRMIAEVMVSTGDILAYLYVNGEMLALLDEANDAGFFVQNDHLGTPQQMTDMADQVVWFRDYQPFGNRAADEPNFAFPGQYADSETGLSYNYFRTYDPSIGRYTQSDPIGLQGGLNTYGYVRGNPVTRIDPTGTTEALLGFCFGGPNPLCVGGLAVNACKWIVVGGITIMLSGDDCDGDSCGESEDPGENPRADDLVTGIGAISDLTGLSPREVRDRIHKAKDNLPRGGPERNPDVGVDPNTGELHPVPKGNDISGDSIGNIHDTPGGYR